MPALAFNLHRSRLIRRIVCMLAAVRLDNQAMLEAGKINDVIADRELAAKFIAFQLPRTQQTPQFLLGGCLLFAKFSGDSGGYGGT